MGSRGRHPRGLGAIAVCALVVSVCSSTVLLTPAPSPESPFSLAPSATAARTLTPSAAAAPSGASSSMTIERPSPTASAAFPGSAHLSTKLDAQEPWALAGKPSVTFERNISPHNADLSYPFDNDFDPIVATDPTDRNRIAVSYHTHRYASAPCRKLVSGLRVTDDGGLTWHEGRGMPWAGTGRAPNWHATIAWGPGPETGGQSRLYWADTTVPGCDFKHHRLSIAYSDDEGATWSHMFIERTTSPTLGGYPDIAVDRNPKSPNYGVVYAAINWFPDRETPPGFRLIASNDFGATWKGVEVPPVGGPTSHAFRYRISYRMRSAPDGSLAVTFFEYDTTDFRRTSFLRMGVGFSLVVFDRSAGTFLVRDPVMVRYVSLNPYTLRELPAPGTTDTDSLSPLWTYGLDVDPVSGHVFLALADYTTANDACSPRGTISIGRSDDNGRTWTWQRLLRLPDVAGHPQSPIRPALAARNGLVFVGTHGLTDLSVTTKPRAGLATVGNYLAVSYDGGGSYTGPVAISSARWDLESLARAEERAGLRDRAEFTADGRVFYVYGDGRIARPSPDARTGRSQIFGALISLGG
jgi:hypothetical protein